ncbi:hypothetical protein ACU686_17940 [Yinghuangia aomiensis]
MAAQWQQYTRRSIDTAIDTAVTPDDMRRVIRADVPDLIRRDLPRIGDVVQKAVTSALADSAREAEGAVEAAFEAEYAKPRPDRRRADTHERHDRVRDGARVERPAGVRIERLGCHTTDTGGSRPGNKIGSDRVRRGPVVRVDAAAHRAAARERAAEHAAAAAARLGALPRLPIRAFAAIRRPQSGRNPLLPPPSPPGAPSIPPPPMPGQSAPNYGPPPQPRSGLGAFAAGSPTPCRRRT